MYDYELSVRKNTWLPTIFFFASSQRFLNFCFSSSQNTFALEGANLKYTSFVVHPTLRWTYMRTSKRRSRAWNVKLRG